MSKLKNINSQKRMEAKRRKKAQKKAQARSSALNDIQTNHLHNSLTTRKLSKVIQDFAKPLIKLAGTDGEEKAIIMSIGFWNASLFPKQKSLETITPVFNDIANGNQEIKDELYMRFDMMYDRKQKYFSDDHRFIVDFLLEETNEGFYLQVASTPFKEEDSTKIEQNNMT